VVVAIDLVASPTEMNFLIVPKTKNARIRFLPVLYLMRALFPVLQMATFSLCLHVAYF
jgi:hypothetical protein